MENAIEFIKHGVLNRKFDEQLSSVYIGRGYIGSFNGVVEMYHKCDTPYKKQLCVDAKQFIHSVKQCNYTPNIKVTDKNVILSYRTFRAQIPYTEDVHVFGTELLKCKKKISVPETFMDKVSLLWPMISDDASRSWSQSILIKKGTAYVTNNILLAYTKCGSMLDCVLPLACVNALIKVKMQPTSMFLQQRHIVFTYSNDSWLRSKLPSSSWPDVNAITKRIKKNKMSTIPKQFKEALNMLKPFDVNDAVIIRKGIATVDNTTVKGIPINDCCLSLKHAITMVNIFTKCDFSNNVMKLSGPKVKGAMAQMVV